MSRFLSALKRVVFQKKTVIFCADLSKLDNETNLSDSYTVRRIRSQGELDKGDLETLNKYHDNEILEKNMTERFNLEAEVWLITQNDELIGFNWTIKKTSMGTYFFPLVNSTVCIFDQEIFPEYRGRGINAMLTMYILNSLKQEGMTHAYISIKEWNQSNLRAISKTIFEKIGVASKFRLLGRVIIIWTEMQSS